MSSREEAGSPNWGDEGSNAGCLALQSGEEVTPHECAMMLADGFHLGVTHYHEYRKAQRELAVCLAEVDAEEAAG